MSFIKHFQTTDAGPRGLPNTDVLDLPFVTQEQKFVYWQESKKEIKFLREQLIKANLS